MQASIQEKPINIFIAYSHESEDKNCLNKLNKFLHPKIRMELLNVWHDEKISAGEYYNDVIEQNLDKSEIILLLLSSNSLSSDYFRKEMNKAKQKQKEKTAIVIPILVSACHWEDEFNETQILPKGAIPLEQCQNQTYKDIVTKIVATISKAKKCRENRIKKEQEVEKNEIERLKKENKSLKEKIETLEKNKKDTRKLKEMATRLTLVEKENEMLVKSEKEAHILKQSTEDDRIAKKNELIGKNKEVNILKEEQNKLENELNVQKSLLKQHQKKAGEDLTKKINEIKGLEYVKKEIEQLKYNLLAEKRKALNKETEMEVLNNRKRELSKNYSKLSIENSNVLERNVRLKKECDNVNQELKEKEKKYTEILKVQHDEIEGVKKKMKDANIKYKEQLDSNEKLSQENQQSEIETDSLKRELKVLKEQKLTTNILKNVFVTILSISLLIVIALLFHRYESNVNPNDLTTKIHKNGKDIILKFVARHKARKLILVEKDGKFGIEDTVHNITIVPWEFSEIKFKDLDSLDRCCVRVKDDKGLFGYYDIDSQNEVTVCKYDTACVFIDHLAWIKKDGKWGLLDENREVIVEPKYDKFEHFKCGRALVKKNAMYGFIDNVGKERIKLEYSNAFSFSEDCAKVRKGGYWGYVNVYGKIIGHLEYENLGNFHEDFAKAKDKNGKWGFIDKKGVKRIDFKYEDARDFVSDSAKVKLDGKWIVITRPKF